MPVTCASVLLAAGGSSRLGRPKQLVKVMGETLLRRSARIAAEAGCSPNLVVLGSQADQLKPELAGLPVKILENGDWRQGIGTSIRCAMLEIQKAVPLPDKVLFLVCDQPHMSSELLRALIAIEGVELAASRYREGFGVPAVFTAKLFAELAQLSGGHGARRIISNHAPEAGFIDFPGGAFDIDTPSDAALLDTGHQPSPEPEY